MHKVTTDPQEYIRTLPGDVQGDIAALDKQIAKVMAGESRVLWQGAFWGGTEQSIIGYGDYTYKRPRGQDVDWFVVGLGAQKNYISVYISAVEDKQYLAEKYAGKLGKVKAGKSTISFKRLADVNLDNLLALVKKARGLMLSES
jgi:hypothetical protein